MKNINFEKIEKVLFIAVLVVITIVQFFYIAQKEGYHEDEIFSYGSSNYKYDNTLLRYGYKDGLNTLIFDEILKSDDVLGKVFYYLSNPDEFNKELESKIALEKPIWKTSDEAREYVAIQAEDVLNYWSVYYNQLRDVHPPLFYFLVHTVSILFFNILSKYAIFIINAAFLILTCIVIRKILKLYNKEYLSIPAIILYTLSIGAISIVVFLRMYQMMTFFVIYSLYLHLKIVKNNFEIDKKLRNRLILSTILGFLTQYYFCVFAALEFICLVIYMLIKKQGKKLIKYIKYLVISAVIGVAIFPASINHIFFSYRGIGASGSGNFIDGIVMYFKEICYGFSVNEYLALGIIAVLLGIMIFLIVTKKVKFRFEMILLTIPAIIYFVIITYTSPVISPRTIIRYVAVLIPIISLNFILATDCILRNVVSKKIAIIVITVVVSAISIWGIATSTPRYLYKGYSEAVEIAKQNRDTKLVYVSDNTFTYLCSVPEFLEYKQYIMIDKHIDPYDEIMNLEDECIIVSLRRWMDYTSILNEVMEVANYSKSELLLDAENAELVLYKLTR